MLNKSQTGLGDRRRTVESTAHLEGPEHRLASSGALMLLMFVLVGSVFELRAQTVQFLPEVDVYYKVDPTVRLDFRRKKRERKVIRRRPKSAQLSIYLSSRLCRSRRSRFSIPTGPTRDSCNGSLAIV